MRGNLKQTKHTATISIYAKQFNSRLAELDAEALGRSQRDLALDRLPAFPTTGGGVVVVRSGGVASRQQDLGSIKSCQIMAPGVGSCVSFIDDIESIQAVAMVYAGCSILRMYGTIAM